MVCDVMSDIIAFAAGFTRGARVFMAAAIVADAEVVLLT